VIAINEGGLHVATADGAVQIRDVQAPGRKRMHAQQFAAGRGIAVGDVLTKPELAP
jgi:methionyl-tRNA formyltransferase